MRGDDEGRVAGRLRRLQGRQSTKRVIAALRQTARSLQPVAKRARREFDATVLRWAAARRASDLPARRMALQTAIDAIPAAQVPPLSVTLFAFPVDETPRRPDRDRPAVSPGTPVDTIEVNGEATTGLATAVAAAETDLLAFLADTSEPLVGGWLAHMATAVASDERVGAAVPAVVHPSRHTVDATPDDLLLREVGLDAELTSEGEVRLAARLAGRPVDERDVAAVDAASAACLVVDRRTFEHAGGWQPLASVDASFVDLACRLRRTGADLVTVPQAVIADHRPVRSPRGLRDPFDCDVDGWQDVIARHGPALARRARSRAGIDTGRPTIAITVASFRRVAPRWGDWHLGQALGRSLQRSDIDVVVVPGDESEGQRARSADIQLVIRGLRPFRRTSGQRQVLWVISHPESIEPAECDAADLVLVASPRFAAELRRRTRTPVEVMLQATDHRRFAPCRPDPRYADPLAVVAKTRDEFRPAVAFALQQGLRPAIYGSGWDDLVDPSLIRADHVPNEQLPIIYSSVGVLLNDHWASMRDWGFVSNRIFDALSCGAPVISDEVEGLTDLFGEVVPTYRDAPGLRRRVEEAFADVGQTRLLAAEGRRLVLERHTFDHRAAALLEALARHGLDRPS